MALMHPPLAGIRVPQVHYRTFVALGATFARGW